MDEYSFLAMKLPLALFSLFCCTGAHSTEIQQMDFCLDYIDKNDGEKAVSTDKNILVSNLLYVVGYIDKDEWEKAKKDNKFIIILLLIIMI